MFKIYTVLIVFCHFVNSVFPPPNPDGWAVTSEVAFLDQENRNCGGNSLAYSQADDNLYAASLDPGYTFSSALYAVDSDINLGVE